jgi:hypothetical protein
MHPIRFFVSLWMPLLCFQACALGLQAQATSTLRPAAEPPKPPASGTPIDFFRQLLVANPETRSKMLAAKSTQHRQVLEKSLRSYDALAPGEREVRLRAMELRYRLSPLLRLTPSNRVERLNQMPEKDRILIRERLRIWDEMSPEDQVTLLVFDEIKIVLSDEPSVPRSRHVPASLQTSNKFTQIEDQLALWQSLPQERRMRVQNHFTNLFGLNEQVNARLHQYPFKPDELEMMKKSLEQFKQLAPKERELCLKNFERFAGLSPEERTLFLLQAQQWQSMRPEYREAWRRLVSRMPPLPPPMSQMPKPKPALVATNN